LWDQSTLDASNTWRGERIDHLSQAKKYLFCMATPKKGFLATSLDLANRNFDVISSFDLCMVKQNLVTSREIYHLIKRDFSHLKDSFMLKQQLCYFYIKCDD
jgi:hypothetical protein